MEKSINEANIIRQDDAQVFPSWSGGLIQDCYTLGAGGGIQSAKTAEVTITSGTIRHCAAVWGGALGLMGPSEASDMELSGNHSDSTDRKSVV